MLNRICIILGVVVMLLFVAAPALGGNHDGETRQGADKVSVCKYTGTPPGGFHHRIEQVSRQATQAPGNPHFADAHDSIVVELGEPCPGESVHEPIICPPGTELEGREPAARGCNPSLEYEDDYKMPEDELCASGPDYGTEEYYASEGGLWWETCVAPFLEETISDDVVADEAVTDTVENEVVKVERAERVEAGGGGTATLPETGLPLALTALLGLGMMGLGTAVLRNT